MPSKDSDIPYYPSGIVNKSQSSPFSVVTLGNPETAVTCSQHVAQKLFPYAEKIGASTFEEAAEEVRLGTAGSFLVPGAYPDVKAFLMDEGFRLTMAVKFPIPALVVTALGVVSERYHRLYYHPATTSLLSHIDCISFVESIAVSSNEVAVERMLVDPDNAAAVTNTLVTAHYRLPVLQILRSERDMAWLLFEPRNVDGGAA